MHEVTLLDVLGIRHDGLTLMRRPLGGTETAVICLFREFAKFGFEVNIYNNAESEGAFDGVKYRSKDFAYELEGKKLDNLVINRVFDPVLNPRLKAKHKFVWLHSLPHPTIHALAPQAAELCDKFIVLSKFEMDKWIAEFPGIPEEKYFLTKNGVDDKVISKYKNTPKKKFKFVYTTTPFRGLEQLLQIWPKIKQRLPEAELQLYGDMGIYGQANGKYQVFYDRAKKMEGISVHGSMRQEDLYREIADAYLYLYPCTWFETSCISAMEAVGLGIPMVAPKIAALPETVPEDCGILLDGDAKNLEFQEKYADAVAEICSNDLKWQTMHKKCLQQDLSWRKVAEQWKKELFV